MSEYVDPFEQFKNKKKEEEAKKKRDEAFEKLKTEQQEPRTDGKPLGFEGAETKRKSLEEIQSEIAPPKGMESKILHRDMAGKETMAAEAVSGERAASFTKDTAGEGQGLAPVEVSDDKPSGMESHLHERSETLEPGEKPKGFKNAQMENAVGEEEVEVETKKPSKITRY